MPSVKNIVVFMSDGVRWDHHPERVRDHGTTFRTVAASLHTPTAIASILSGLYLPRHGVRGFTDSMPADVSTVLDWFPHAGLNVTPGNFNEAIYSHLLERYDQIPLSDIEEPFGWFMRDPGGHAPYDGFDEDLQTDESVRSYLEKHGGNEERIRQDYAAGVESSVDRFERHVLDSLRERGILDRALVVFISDHGQMFGEYGHVGESYPACPEIAYVPTTLIHPSLPAVERDGLFRHVDLLPTAADLLNGDSVGGDGSSTDDNWDGVDVLADGTEPEYGACFYDRPYPSLLGEFSYTIDSLWTRNGGYVFVRSGLWDKIRVTAGLLTRIPAGIHVRRARRRGSLKRLFENQRIWNDPDISAEDADRILEDIKEGEYRHSSLDLDDAAEENLRELGYL